MAETVFTSREFNQDASRAKRATKHGPVIITDRGKAAHVLLNLKDYQRLLGKDEQTIVDMLASPETQDIEFDPPKLRMTSKPADFS